MYGFFARCQIWCTLLVLLLLASGCSLLQKREDAGSVQAAIDNPLSPEETDELIGEASSNWFYGHGFGETVLAAGVSFIFPPYAVYSLGNAALSVAGYKEVRVTDALPTAGRDNWNMIYDGVTSVPGSVTSAVAGEDFRNRQEAKEAVMKFAQRNMADTEKSGTWQ